MLNQKIVRSTMRNIGGYIHGDNFVLCAKCKQEVSLSVSYFDPYLKGGAQVHYDCLSVKRKDEIEAELNKAKERK